MASPVTVNGTEYTLNARYAACSGGLYYITVRKAGKAALPATESTILPNANKWLADPIKVAGIIAAAEKIWAERESR